MNDKKQNPPLPPIIPQNQKDSFQEYKKDPRLENPNPQYIEKFEPPALYHELLKEIGDITEKEPFYRAIRVFKKKKVEDLETLEALPFQNRRKILKNLSEVAQAILFASYHFIKKNLETEYGLPSYLNAYKQNDPSYLALVAMGKLGALEMNYESDIDMIFLYSHHGEVIGKKCISNQEYFSKFAQRLLNMLSLATAHGICYRTDVELRPSGNQGQLVISFEHFLNHQMNQSQNWERLALLRSKPLVAPKHFTQDINTHINSILTAKTISENFYQDIRAIREKVQGERSQQTQEQFDLKCGPGGTMDLDFIIQGLQLRHIKIHPNLNTANAYDSLSLFKSLGILPKDKIKLLESALNDYHTFLSALHRLEKRSHSVLQKDQESLQNVANLLRIQPKEILDRITEHQKMVSQTFLEIYETA